MVRAILEAAKAKPGEECLRSIDIVAWQYCSQALFHRWMPLSEPLSAVQCSARVSRELCRAPRESLSGCTWPIKHSGQISGPDMPFDLATDVVREPHKQSRDRPWPLAKVAQ